MKTHFYDLKFNDTEGSELSMNAYKGKVILIINTPLELEQNDQLTELDHIYLKYRDQGLEVLVFPSEDFSKILPVPKPLSGSKEKKLYSPAFPVMQEVQVRGKDVHPLFQYLTEGKSALFINKIKWNYTKFLVSREGTVVSRHSPQKPISHMEEEIQELLAG